VKTSARLRVVGIEELGIDLPMYDITTGTGDFVANGVISHNCYARGTHSWLELDTGTGFDREIVVKVNVGEVLAREVVRPTWTREHVALGTNTDPYQRAEGRYALMPGIIKALAGSGTPFSILTKGTLLRRDLPLLRDAAADVPIGLGVSLAIHDDGLHAALEPGTPDPRARLALVRAMRDAGLPCGVMLAPVLPWLTDTEEHLDRALSALKDAGATGVTVLALHLRPGAREWFFAWLARERPDLVKRYEALYARGANVPGSYRRSLAARVQPLLERHGFARQRGGAMRGIPGDEDAEFPQGSLPSATDAPADPPAAQLTLLE
jgi:DNA repair photolyase